MFFRDELFAIELIACGVATRRPDLPLLESTTTPDEQLLWTFLTIRATNSYKICG
jgi:hypothetical protein